MSLLYWIVFGFITGSIANYLAPNPREGFVGSVLLGIIGAIVGGYLGESLFNVGITGFNLPSIVIGVLGALLVLFLSRMFFRNTR